MQKLPERDTETQNEQILLEKWPIELLKTELPQTFNLLNTHTHTHTHTQIICKTQQNEIFLN